MGLKCRQQACWRQRLEPEPGSASMCSCAGAERVPGLPLSCAGQPAAPGTPFDMQAALMAHLFDDLLAGMLLLDAYPLAVSVGRPGSNKELVIPPSTTIPTAKFVELAVDDPRQTELLLTVGRSCGGLAAVLRRWCCTAPPLRKRILFPPNTHTHTCHKG